MSREEAEGEAASPWPVAISTAAITIIFWAVAMQTRPPFSLGQSMAWGFLIGGLTGAAAAIIGAHLRGGTLRSRQMAALCMFFLGLFAASLVYVLFRGCPEWAMLGLGAGALMTGILGLALGAGSRASMLTGVFAVFALVTTTAVIFAVNHFDQPGQRIWWPVPILMAATVGLAVFVGIVISTLSRSEDKPGRSCALCALMASAIVVGLSAIYAPKIVGQWQLLWVVAAGIGVTAIAAWIAMLADRADDDAALTQAGAVAAVVAVVLVVIAFKLWAGLGIAIGLLAALAVAVPLLGLVGERTPASSNAVRGLVMFVASALLFRLFIEYYRSDLATTDLRIHYTFIGAILGALMPRVLSSCRHRASCGPWCSAAGIAFVGLVAAASPLVLLLLWGIKAAMGFVFGLTAALAIRYADSLKDMGLMRTEALLALAAQFTAVAFVSPLLDMELTRVHRVIVLAAALVVAIAWLLISGGLSRRRAH
jgi:hypothetical protein